MFPPTKPRRVAEDWVSARARARVEARTPWARVRAADVPDGWAAQPDRSALAGFERLPPVDALRVARAAVSHRNGWVRQDAVAYLGLAGAEVEDLEVVLPRLADVVRPIRAAACGAVEQLVERLGTSVLVPLGDVVGRLRTRVRWTDAEDVLLAAHLGPHTSELAQRLNAATPAEARWSTFVLTFHGASVAELALRAASAGDVRTARGLLDAFARTGPTADAWAPVLEAARRSPHASVRSFALLRTIQLGGPDVAARIAAGAVDRARAVRWIAQHRGAKLGLDVAGVCRDALGSGAPLGSIPGLGETGVPADVERLVPLLDDTPRRARLALDAIARLDADEGAGWAEALVADTRRGVVREAVRILRRRGGAMPAQARAWVAGSPYGLGPLVLGLPAFDALGLLLDHPARSAAPWVRTWLARDRRDGYWRTPAPEWAASLRAAVGRAGLPEDLAAELRLRLGR